MVAFLQTTKIDRVVLACIITSSACLSPFPSALSAPLRAVDPVAVPAAVPKVRFLLLKFVVSNKIITLGWWCEGKERKGREQEWMDGWYTH